MNEAELERLALLLEEAGEVQQVIGKILRHGWNSRYPITGTTNREKFREEIIDLMAALSLLVQENDMVLPTDEEFNATVARKNNWLHHNRMYPISDVDDLEEPLELE